jgi:GT2 family glycosyltransferase
VDLSDLWIQCGRKIGGIAEEAVNPLPAYSVVIPTNRAGEMLVRTLRSLKTQTHPPQRVVVVDATPEALARDVCLDSGLPDLVHVHYQSEPSAARQRNDGASHVDTPLIGFFDDDMEILPETLEMLCSVWVERPETGGVAARIDGLEHRVPSRLLWCYYRIQAGYAHPNYGACLFGPAINCLPAYAEGRDALIPAMWLNAGCVVYRTDFFKQERFPEFSGYAFMEDVHLSARLARNHSLYFHREARVVHLDGGTMARRKGFALSRMMMRNRRCVAADVMGLGPWQLAGKLFLHRIFNTVVLCQSRKPGWMAELAGTWCPW